MAEKRMSGHPGLDRLVDLDDLDDLEEGRPADPDADDLRAHLAECVSCRLELDRYRDFLAAGDDSDSLDDSGWDRAELPLQRAFDTVIRPSARRSRRVSWLRLVPVAAAAVLALVVLNLDRLPFGDGPAGDDPLRGGGAASAVIRPEQPIEAVPAAPREFTWTSDREFDSYILEVFTPDLEPVLRMTDLRETRAVVPDSLAGLMQPGLTYLWNVQGRSGLAEGELSLTAWFRIGPPAVGGM